MKLEVVNLSAGYGSAKVINGLNFTLPSSGSLAVVGRNGMGKSTLLKTVMGLLTSVTGSILLDGKEVRGVSPTTVARMGVAYAPQECAVFGNLSVAENLSAANICRPVSAQRRREISELFPVLGQRSHQTAATLSGGEQRMLVLARVLLSEPSLIILDEITAGLQPSMIARVQEALRWERKTRHTALLLVEQNLDFAIKLTDRVAVMKLGNLILDLPTDALNVRETLLRQLAP